MRFHTNSWLAGGGDVSKILFKTGLGMGCFAMLRRCLVYLCLVMAMGTRGVAQSEDQVRGSRIGWDFTTLRKVSSPVTSGSCGYARMIELRNDTLLTIYEASGSVVLVRSSDSGNTWSGPVVVAKKEPDCWMSVPDVLELADKSLLACYNPRPAKNSGKRFTMRIKKSYDGGATWVDERDVYQAGEKFHNGCWEPSAIQLPDGEIQLFFANEKPYEDSAEQNISVIRSRDGGITWSPAQIASFRAGHRDGMPSPMLLMDRGEIVCAIEDNATSGFKPFIVRSPMENSWRSLVTGESKLRNYALAQRLDDDLYAGAPFLRRLPTGETVLSYQGTEGRPNRMLNAEMKVVIGGSDARNFNRKTAPFSIPLHKRGLWNSLCVLTEGTVVALTSTNAWSGWASEVWMIKGHLIPELEITRAACKVDGSRTEKIWNQTLPLFVGQTSATQLRSSLCYDDRYIYVMSLVQDTTITTGLEPAELCDGITVQIASPRTKRDLGKCGAFECFLSADDRVVTTCGMVSYSGAKAEPRQILHAVRRNTGNYLQELAIPWSFLGGKPTGKNASLQINLLLTENPGDSRPHYVESLGGNDRSSPSTWLKGTIRQ
jgi:hypothetical protein